MFGDEMIDEASRKMADQIREPRRAGRPQAQPRLSVGPRSRAAEGQPMRRRAITLRASVSSAPSKMDSTRASTK